MIKKFLVLFVTLSTVVLMSCKGGKKESGDGETSKQIAVSDSISVEFFQTQLDKFIAKRDTAKIQQLVSQSQTTYQKMVATDKTAAETFAEKIRQIVTFNPDLATIIPNIESLVAKVTAVPATTEILQEAPIEVPESSSDDEAEEMEPENIGMPEDDHTGQITSKGNSAPGNNKNEATEPVHNGINNHPAKH